MTSQSNAVFTHPVTGEDYGIKPHESVHRWGKSETYLIVSKLCDITPPEAWDRPGDELMYRLVSRKCKTWNPVWPMTLGPAEPLDDISSKYADVLRKLGADLADRSSP